MIEEEYCDLQKHIDNQRTAVHKKKRLDYAGEGDDALLNFKQVGIICAALDIDTSRSAEDIALFQVVHKIQRYCSLRNRTPVNESVFDSVIDLHNYVDLAYACKIDAEREEQLIAKITKILGDFSL